MSRSGTVASSKQREHNTVLKTSLLHPYILSWPQLHKGTAPYILAELNKFFTSICEEESASESGLGGKPVISKLKAILGKQVVFGIREVTKGLERDQLSLVLVCRSIKPLNVINHILLYSSTNNVKAACVPDLSNHLCKLLGLKRASTVGFVKNPSNNSVQKLLENICDRLEPLTLPWTWECISEAGQVNTNKRQHTDDLQLFVPTKICVNRSRSKKLKSNK